MGMDPDSSCLDKSLHLTEPPSHTLAPTAAPKRGREGRREGSCAQFGARVRVGYAGHVVGEVLQWYRAIVPQLGAFEWIVVTRIWAVLTNLAHVRGGIVTVYAEVSANLTVRISGISGACGDVPRVGHTAITRPIRTGVPVTVRVRGAVRQLDDGDERTTEIRIAVHNPVSPEPADSPVSIHRSTHPLKSWRARVGGGWWAVHSQNRGRSTRQHRQLGGQAAR